MAENVDVVSRDSARPRRHLGQWLLALVGVVVGVVFVPPIVDLGGSSAPSLEPLRTEFGAAGYDCRVLASGKKGIITESIVCSSGDLRVEMSSHSNGQKQDEIVRFISENVGCPLAHSRAADRFDLFTADRITAFIAGGSVQDLLSDVPSLGTFRRTTIQCGQVPNGGVVEGPVPPSA